MKAPTRSETPSAARTLRAELERALEARAFPRADRPGIYDVLAELADFMTAPPARWTVDDLDRFYRLRAPLIAREERPQWGIALGVIAEVAAQLGDDVSVAVGIETPGDNDTAFGGKAGDAGVLSHALEIILAESAVARPDETLIDAPTRDPLDDGETQVSRGRTTIDTGDHAPTAAAAHSARLPSLERVTSPVELATRAEIPAHLAERPAAPVEDDGLVTFDEGLEFDETYPAFLEDVQSAAALFPAGVTERRAGPAPTVTPMRGSRAVRPPETASRVIVPSPARRATETPRHDELEVVWAEPGWVEVRWSTDVGRAALRRTLDGAAFTVDTRGGAGCLLDMRRLQDLRPATEAFLLRWLGLCGDDGLGIVAVVLPAAGPIRGRVLDVVERTQSGVHAGETLADARGWLRERSECQPRL